MTAVRVNLNRLFEALTAKDEGQVTAQIAAALAEDVAPSKLIGRLAIPAALGDSIGSPLASLVAAGQAGDWIRIIPPGPEPGADRRQQLLPVALLVAAALRAAPAIASGLHHPDAAVPEPLFPKDITAKDGPWGALRDAFVTGDQQAMGRVLMGFYGSGTDYREIIGAISYATLGQFAADGHAPMATLTATQALDFVDWGDRFPALIQWLLPKLVPAGAEPEGAAAVRTALAQPERDLDFVRTRLALSKATAAGAALRQAIARGTTEEVIDAVFAALKGGANGAMVGAQICVVAAEHLATTPFDLPAALDHAVVALRVANAARVAVTQVQDIRVLPIVFQAANLVNVTIRALGDRRATAQGNPAGAALQGGLIEHAILRNLRYQLVNRDEVGARATLRRYTQMTFPPRSACGMLSLAAARANLDEDQGRAILVADAAGAAFIALTPRQQAEEGVALLDAIVHAIIAQNTDTALADRVEVATGTAAAQE